MIIYLILNRIFNSMKEALFLTMVLNFLTLVFQVLVLMRVIPFHIVWGGRLTSASQMYRMVSVSILVNVFIAVVCTGKAGWLALPVAERGYTILFVCFAWMFALNTIDNLFSKNKWEKIIFTPITLLLAALSTYIALN
ncbi:MAG: hypothetical protein IPO27_03325 [Bacteroidetes bacterium]|nr:hypothetical protein [Bacteroidota bacterium]